MRQFRTRFLMQSQIESAMKITRSNRAAARYLRVSYTLYKKFAKAYRNHEGISLFDAHRNQAGRGVPKNGNRQSKFKLDDILLGKYPNYPKAKLLRRLIASGYMEEKCSQCGFCQKRPLDLKTPLVLTTINGVRNDFRRDNLELLCYNCYFVLIGDLSKSDMKAGSLNDIPEQSSTFSIFDSEEHAAAINSMDLLSDAEKQELLDSLRDL